MKKISIVIPTYEAGGRGPEFLNELLFTINYQNYKDFEVIVCDHSTSNIIKNVVDEWSAKGLSINYVLNPHGRGNASINANMGIKQATGDFIKIMHQDDLFDSPYTIDLLMKNILNNPQLKWGAFGYNHLYHNEQGRNLSGPVIPTEDKIGCPSVSFFINECNYFDENINDLDIHTTLTKKYGEPLIIKDICITLRIHKKNFDNKLSEIINYGLIKQERFSKKDFENRIIDLIIKDMGFGSFEHFFWAKNQAEKKNYCFNINENSFIVDAGGYEGNWSEEIFKRYHCNIHIFEPIKSFYQNICLKFKENSKIIVYCVGLGGEDRKEKIILNKDASSIYIHGDNYNVIKIIDFNNWLKINDIKEIDLMKINIEGCEYELLNSIIKNENQKKIKNLLIQFHKFPENYKSNRNNIIYELGKTHDLIFCYDYVWEHWKLR